MGKEATLTPHSLLDDYSEDQTTHISFAPDLTSGKLALIDGLTMSAETFMGIDVEWPLTQLIEGRILMSPAPSFNHQESSGNLYTLLRSFVKARKLGVIITAPCDWMVDEDTVVQPDLMWYAADHPKIKNRSNKERTPPDLVVEILSPSNAKMDTLTKREIYRRAGVAHYWMVDIETKSFTGLELRDGEYHSCGETLEGVFRSAPFADLDIPLAEIFDWT